MLRFSIIVIALSLFTLPCFSEIDSSLQSYYDLAPGLTIPGGNPSQPTDDQWDMLYWWNLEEPTGNNGLSGIVFDGELLWITNSNSTTVFYLVNPQTNSLVGQITSGIPEPQRLRDLCTDGTYIYGGRESGIQKFEIETRSFVNQFTFPPGMSFPRAMAYDPASDHFYCGNFGSQCYEMDHSSNLIRSWSPAPLSAIYGMAWDYDAPDGPWLWIHDQTNPVSGCNVWQMDPATLTYTGYHITLNISTGNDMAGGLEYCQGLDPVYSTMLALSMSTPDQAAAFEMYPVNPPASPLNLTPYAQPIFIPANGGSFEFNIAYFNTAAATINTDVWTTVTLPDSSIYGPIINANITIPPETTVDRDRIQSVPANAPPGLYTYNAFAGQYPVMQYEDHFNFTKLTVGDNTFGIDNWLCQGEAFSDSPMELPAPLQELFLHPPYPNPFNNSTVIKFELPYAGNIHLNIFNSLGQIVFSQSTYYLSIGYYEYIWDAGTNSSGMYFIQLTDNLGKKYVQKAMLIK